MGKPKADRIYVIEKSYSENGYDFTRFEIKPGTEESLTELIAGCTDDRYRAPGAADKQRRLYTWLQDQGYTGIWNYSYDCAAFEVEFQHYDPADKKAGDPQQYCEASIRLSRKLAELRSSLKLFDRILARAEKLGHTRWGLLNDPKYLRDTLARMGATPITRVVVYPADSGWSCTMTELCTSRVLASLTAHKAAS